jgi:phosphoglycolate phosphatase-like HAD superfamily hydrolase
MSPPLLVLFDIDGTLILSGRAGVRGLRRAFDRLYGMSDVVDGIPLSGRTDRAIVIEALEAIGRAPEDDEILRLRDVYCECLALEIVRPVTAPSGVLPGVVSLLDALDHGARAHVGLLTGNFERGAAIKLGHFDLGSRFRFGAFGDDHVDRRDLVPVALERARASGVDVPPPDRVIVVGDTPLDVDCAKAHGARAVAVATGGCDRASLEASGADLVLDSLAELDRFRAWTAALG